MNRRVGWWSNGAYGRSLGCDAGRCISRAEKFDCDLGQVGPESILLLEPLYLEEIARIDLRKATSIWVQIMVPNEDVIILIDIVLAFP